MPDELVALEGRGEGRISVLAQHCSYAAQPDFAPCAGRLRKRDNVFDRLTYGNRLSGGKQHSRGTHILGLAFGLLARSGTDHLKWEVQVKALILSFFGHSN